MKIDSLRGYVDTLSKQLEIQTAYAEALQEQSLTLKALDRDPARVAAYRELLDYGEFEAANMALYGSDCYKEHHRDH